MTGEQALLGAAAPDDGCADLMVDDGVDSFSLLVIEIQVPVVRDFELLFQISLHIHLVLHVQYISSIHQFLILLLGLFLGEIPPNFVILLRLSTETSRLNHYRRRIHHDGHISNLLRNPSSKDISSARCLSCNPWGNVSSIGSC